MSDPQKQTESSPPAQPSESDPGKASPYAEAIFLSLRRMIRAIDLHSREVIGRSRLTVSQLVCLRQLWLSGPATPSRLARAVYLSQATVTGILDRLESRGLVTRERNRTDRRLVGIRLTEAGSGIAESMPIPLQGRFAERLAALPREEQADIDRVLGRIVDMMEAKLAQPGPSGTEKEQPEED